MSKELAATGWGYEELYPAAVAGVIESSIQQL